MRFILLLYISIALVGCNQPKTALPSQTHESVIQEKRLSKSLNTLMDEFGNDQKVLLNKIQLRLENTPTNKSIDILLLKAAIAVADDKLDIAKSAIDEIMTFKSLSNEQKGLALLFRTRTHYSLGQINELNSVLKEAITLLNDTNDPALTFWLASEQVLISGYTQDKEMFNRSTGYVLSRLDLAPNNLLGQSMLNVIAIGLTTGRQYDKAIDIENFKVKRDEAFGNIKGLSDSYYNLGNLYRNLLQPELALLNFMQCFDYSAQLGSELDQAFALQQMGAVALELEDYENAEEWAREAHALAHSTKTQQLYIPTKVTLAKVIASSMPSESRSLLNEARVLSAEYNVENYIKEIEVVEEQLEKQNLRQLEDLRPR